MRSGAAAGLSLQASIPCPLLSVTFCDQAPAVSAGLQKGAPPEACLGEAGASFPSVFLLRGWMISAFPWNVIDRWALQTHMTYPARALPEAF